MIGPQPMFLNAAATGESILSAPALLDVLLAVEQRFGRERPYARAPRTIDLDLILYGNDVIKTEGLTVPHPRFRERRFVLEPLAEIAADWIDPVTGKTIGELLSALGGSERTRPTTSTE
jgi:2-amino-4-hydroxy-6-hydroxymethyldihydropteridine diphosphokinase